MREISVTIHNKAGLHARPASMFVNMAQKFASEILIAKNGKKANGKSIIGVLSLGVIDGDQLYIYAAGDDESDAIAAIENLVNTQLLHA